MPDKPRTPSFALQRIFAMRDRLADVLLPFAGKQWDEGVLIAAATALAEAVPKLQMSVIADSMRTHVGRQPTLASLYNTAWRFAGNMKRLRQGQCVHPWSRQVFEEWVPVMVVAAEPQFYHGAPGLQCSLQVHAGSPCPRVLSEFLSDRLIGVLSRRIGFGRGRSKTAMFNRMEVVSMLMVAKLSPEKSTFIAPGCGQYACPPSYVKRNKQLILMRHRVGFACPCRYTHPCHLCHVGTDVCVCGVRPVTLGGQNEV